MPTTSTHEQAAARETSRVALVTCDRIPDLEDDDRLALAPLSERAVTAEPVVWDDPAVDWAAYDLVVLRSTWDYASRRDEFVAWAGRVAGLANPADVVVWNTDKRYLRELAAAGVPIIPTDWVEPGAAGWSGAWVDVILKPAIGAGSVDAGRYRLDDPVERQAFDAHLARLTGAGRTALVQPYLGAVETAGETALVFLQSPDGLRFSHAATKGALLAGPDEGVDGLYREETITPRTATAAELAVAERALSAIPGGVDRLLYARVDLIPADDGTPVLIELELTEPSLFLGTAGGAKERFADAVAAAVRAG
ncbi:hypothetical protein SAMN05421684_2824 [Asanoa ishikariensis]|uniref:ATP-grasp domain-containing protein n=1 Tax=Asanoa ishikariensis TaxID=137265 RepID=A0A1H3PEY2_9ACTN|nr:hypothetical protein [Asanoa ishikariensis]SDY99503.1 hypothetical protein SAMN05421684_2824 [Asanoa ishikariensis]